MHPALRSYVGVADLLVRTFADCEVVLHDLTVPHARLCTLPIRW